MPHIIVRLGRPALALRVAIQVLLPVIVAKAVRFALGVAEDIEPDQHNRFGICSCLVASSISMPVDPCAEDKYYLRPDVLVHKLEQMYVVDRLGQLSRKVEARRQRVMLAAWPT